MKKFLTLLVVSLLGCGPAFAVPPVYADGLVPGCPLKVLAFMHEVAFTKYLVEFQRDASRKRLHCYPTYALYFTESMEGGVAGYCVPGDRIVINKEMWYLLTDSEKKVLMYHELGHCALGLDHTAEKEIAIMNPYLLPDHLSERRWQELVDGMMDIARKKQQR